MQAQKDEFDAAYELSKAYDGLAPIVDDDYPETRHRYEGAVKTFLKACKANGRYIQVHTIDSLDHIMELNLARCEEWHKGDQPWTAERWITAIVGELGEMANNVKKLFRASDGSVGILKGETPEKLQEEIEKEWADTMLYMLLFAGYNNIHPFSAIAKVFNAKSEQLGFEQRL